MLHILILGFMIGLAVAIVSPRQPSDYEKFDFDPPLHNHYCD